MNIENWRQLWRFSNAICLLGIAQFLICTLIAIQYYPGGTQANDLTAGFSMTENFLSDLGRSVAHNGDSNSASAFWFNNSMIFMVVSMIPFYLAFCFHAWDRTTVLWFAGGFGLVSLLGLLVIALAPYDTHFILHNLGLALWIGTTIFAAGLHAGAMLTSNFAPMWLALVSIAFAMLMMAYAVAGSMSDYARMQKIAVGGAMLWYGILSAWVLLKMEEYIHDIEDPGEEFKEISQKASKYAFEIRSENRS